MKKVMFIGRTQCGKTTLSQRILNEDIKYHKTQTLGLVGNLIYDTPGEYVERKMYRGALFVAAADADLMVFMQDATEDGSYFPPMYRALFPKPAIGLVTKADIATPDQIEEAKKHLHDAGLNKIIVISSVTGEGIDEFLQEVGFTDEMLQEARSIAAKDKDGYR